jgi:hypothetical protein
VSKIIINNASFMSFFASIKYVQLLKVIDMHLTISEL